jgi:hypothetical protein
MRPGISSSPIVRIIVDYRCSDCGVRSESFVTSPAPSTLVCGLCGGESVRRWSPVGMITSTRDPAPPREPRPSASLCAQNPDIPGLCHMSPTAGRAWVARARGDHRALDAELARQEAAAAVVAPTMADAISHGHSHGSHTHQ